MAELQNNQGAQTELVKSWLISFIKEQHLQIGDKLPSQVQLRDKLGVGSLTIQRAILALSDAGIIESRKNSGVYLKNTDMAGYFGRKIGIVCLRIPSSICSSIFLQDLQFSLHDRGVQCINILRDNSPMREKDDIGMFSGLERLISQRAIDGLILTVPMKREFFSFCKKHNIPCCYYGDRSGIVNCVRSVYYQPEVIQLLCAEGCHRPAVLLSSRTSRHFLPKKLLEDLQKNYGKTFADAIWMLKRDDFQPGGCRSYLGEVSKIAQTFIQMSASERPDGFFIPDDFLTAAFCQHLSEAGIPLPKFIIQSNKQIPIAQPSSVIGYYENDLEKHATATADMMFGLLDRPTHIFKEPVICASSYISNQH